MTSDVTVSSFIICLDVVHNLFDSQAFFDYLKNNHKKNIIFINAGDFVDSNGRSSRSSSSSTDSHGGHSRISYKSLSKSINNKITNELGKLIDQKRKLIAQNEKKAQQLAKANRPTSSASGHSKTSTETNSPPPFDGQTEVVFIIQGFPYSESQLKALCSYVDFGAFISIVSQTQPNDANTTTNITVQPKKSSDKNSRSATGRKATIHGSEIDSALNPGVVPPPRWKVLMPIANSAITFSQIDAPHTLDECWTALDYEIGRIIRCRNEFSERFSDHKFIILPAQSQKKPDMGVYNKFLSQHDNNDIINAIMTQIDIAKKNDSVPPPQPQPAKEDIYNRIFREINDKIMRLKIAQDPEEPIKPFFDQPVQINSAFDILYKLLKWKLDDENAPVNKAVLDFYANYSNFNAVAGHQFEVMLSQANKRLSLGLPLSFFEWTKFLYAYEYQDITSTIIDIFKKNYVFDTVLEETAGVMWVLAMPPVSRTIGQSIRKLYMPPAFDGISEWLTKIFDRPPPTAEAKGRSQSSPAQILKSGGNIETLIPNIFQRTENKENAIYKVPMDLGKSADLVSPFFFTNGVQADVNRSIINNKMTFGYYIHFPNELEISSYYNSINIELHKICRLIFNDKNCKNSENESEGEVNTIDYHDKSLTILKNEDHEVSIFYENGQLSLKAGQAFVITESGALIFELKGDKIILESNGRIRKWKDGNWTYSEPDGRLFKVTEEGNVPLNNPHNKLTDLRTGISRIIRDDNILYSIYSDGERVIQFSDHFIIRQTQDSIVYEIPKLPFITFRDKSFTFLIDDACFVLNTTKMSISKESTSIDYDYNEVVIQSFDSEVSLKQGILQMKAEDNVLYADNTGTQRIGPIIPSNTPIKKKVEVVESKWGKIMFTKDTFVEANHLQLLSIFRPRFFAIRSDLSATEYIHREGFIPKNRVQKERHADDVYDVITLHEKNEKPLVYLKQNVLEKQPRSALLKTLQIPKKSRAKTRPKKGQEPEDPELIKQAARESNQKYLAFWRNVLKIQNQTCEQLEQEYLEEIKPKPIPPPEIIEPPVFTPDPRLLEMMHMKYAPTDISNFQDDNVINYWESPEAEYAFPLETPPVLPRPLSPRTKLFDMPPDEAEKLHRKGYDEPPAIPEEEYDFSLTSQARDKRKEKEREAARVINTARTATGHYQNSLQVISDLKPPYSASSGTRDDVKPIPPSNSSLDTQPSPRRFSNRIYSTEVSRPQTAHSTVKDKNRTKPPQKKVEFGDVALGKTVTASLDIQNTGNRPLHYSVSRPNNKDVVMNTIPGVIMPGLKLAIKLTLNAREVGKIETSFKFMSPLGDMTIPVTANIVDVNIEEEEEDI